MCKISGILLLSGYHSLPEEHHYWSRQQKCRCSNCVQNNEQEQVSQNKEVSSLCCQPKLSRRGQNE